MSTEENIRFFQAVQAYFISFLKEMEKPPASVSFYKKDLNLPEQAIYWDMTIEYGVMYMDMLCQWSETCITRLENLMREPSDE